MLSIFVEASCNRYVRDECRFCHVYPPLKPILGSREDWHMMPDTARLMAEKIRSIVPLKDLAKKRNKFDGRRGLTKSTYCGDLQGI